MSGWCWARVWPRPATTSCASTRMWPRSGCLRRGTSADLRTRPDRARPAQRGRRPSVVHHAACASGQGVADHVHRRRHAPGRGRVGRLAARARRGAGDRPGDGRLPGHRQQEHGAGRHRREGARHHPSRDHAPVQRGEQPGISQAGCRGRRLHEARSRGDWRRRSARRRADGGALPAVHAHRRADHGDGLRQRRALRSTPPTPCSRRASRS